MNSQAKFTLQPTIRIFYQKRPEKQRKLFFRPCFVFLFTGKDLWRKIISGYFMSSG